MFGHILKRDLKRKKTMNAILFIFIVIAAMFMAGSIPNIFTVINGVQYYEKIAGVGDYVVIAGDSQGDLTEFINNCKAIDSYRMEEIVLISGDILYKDGEKLETRPTKVVQTVKDTGYKYFDNDNNEIKEIKPGQIMITKYAAEENNLKIGDKIEFIYKNNKFFLEYAGPIKDAILGTPMMGNTRVLISEEDFNRFQSDDSIGKALRGKILYIDTKDTKQVEKDLANVSTIFFNGDKSIVDMVYIMEMVIAATVLIIGIALIIVSFIVLKFMISFTISEEFREIGVMKAIGIKNGKIRSLYIVKYMAFGIVGSVLGFILSIPFGRLMLDIVSSNMVLGNELGTALNLIGAVFVVVSTVGFAYLCTKKIKKSSPIDAIRNGQTGERYKKKKGFSIEKCPLGSSSYMAINDVKSAPRRYMTIIVAFTLCCLLPLIIGNTASTMKSDKLIHLFGQKKSDIYVDANLYIDQVEKDGDDIGYYKKVLGNVAEKIEKETGYKCDGFLEIQYRFDVSYKGESSKIACQIGINTNAGDYKYTEGVAPAAANEIAITKMVSKTLGAKIGDTVTIKSSDGEKECIVTAYFDAMNNLGQIIRIHEDFEVNSKDMSGSLNLQFSFADNPSDDEIDRRIQLIKDKCDFENVLNTKESCAKNIGVVDTMETVELFLIVFLIIVVILVTILMESSFIANEKSQIAMLKAVGFSNGYVIAWQVKRFGLVGLVSLVLAIVLSIPATPLIITPIFKMLGAESIDYVFDKFKVFVMYPVIILAVTMLFTYIGALKTKRIKATDTANIE
ncbi:MAG: FtsX-like permease family protein [Lachnospiraceae bacterium]|nr:FtsX-like permease family protein [Lachnospiraceae bacterium]